MDVLAWANLGGFAFAAIILYTLHRQVLTTFGRDSKEQRDLFAAESKEQRAMFAVESREQRAMFREEMAAERAVCANGHERILGAIRDVPDQIAAAAK